MSPDTTLTPDVEFSHAAVPLLKEYTGKLVGLAREALDYLKNAQPVMAVAGTPLGDYSRALRDSLDQQIRNLLPPAEELARQTSSGASFSREANCSSSLRVRAPSNTGAPGPVDRENFTA